MTELTFQAEKWPTVKDELKLLAPIHWKEVEECGDGLEFCMDEEAYELFHEVGVLHYTTVRNEGKLVGYYANFVVIHPHYKGILFATLDAYYIQPEFRRPTVGLRLFIEMEEQMKALGVKKMTSTATHKFNVKPLFDRLGWEAKETTFTKVIG